MDNLSPGFAAAFQKSRELLGAAYEASLKDSLPNDPNLELAGVIDAPGAAIPFHARRQGADLEITLGDGAAVLAKPDDPDAGFLRWRIACPEKLPTCAGSTNPDAWLCLTRSGGRLLGHLFVENRLGAFPYGLSLATRGDAATR
jgi:hypothetical protein